MNGLCDVYRSNKLSGLYLYVLKSDGLSKVPEELLRRFGKPEYSLSLMLTKDRKLAKEDPELVLANLSEQGFHLQLPPETKANFFQVK